MSARALRLLISVAVVFGAFFYLCSLQINNLAPVKAPDTGLLGGPIPGLTRWQLEKFEEGRVLFAKEFGLKDGLGPLYNGILVLSVMGAEPPQMVRRLILPKTILLWLLSELRQEGLPKRLYLQFYRKLNWQISIS